MCRPEQEMPMTPTPPATGPNPAPNAPPNYAMMGFLAATIAILGMTGVMATYVTPLPLERALAREVVLDQLLADNGANYAQLRPRLADSAEAVKPGPDLAARIAAERVAMRARLQAETDSTAGRLQLMLLVCSLGAMLFGAVGMGARRRRP
jgi:hypothetical protein